MTDYCKAHKQFPCFICGTEHYPGCKCSVCAPSSEERRTIVKMQEDIDTTMKEHVDSVRNYNVGNSDYAEHKIQPWDIWLEYELNPWDADIVKRTLRDKAGDSRILDYQKIKHICDERIRQLQEDADSSNQTNERKLPTK